MKNDRIYRQYGTDDRFDNSNAHYRVVSLCNILQEDIDKLDKVYIGLSNIHYFESNFYGVPTVDVDVVVNVRNEHKYREICKMLQNVEYDRLVNILPKLYQHKESTPLDFVNISRYYQKSNLEYTPTYYEKNGSCGLLLEYEFGWKGTLTRRFARVTISNDNTTYIVENNNSSTSPVYFTGSCRNDTSVTKDVVTLNGVDGLNGYIQNMRKQNWY